MPIDPQTGVEVDENGVAIPGQANPTDAYQPPGGTTQNKDYNPQYDAEKDLFYVVQSGKKQYISPYGAPAGTKGSGFGQLTHAGGGALHKAAEWDADTGTFKNALDWGKIVGYAVGGAVGGEALTAAGGAGGTGGATSALGPSTPANMAATTAAVTPPAALTPGVGTVTGVGSALSTVGKVGSLISDVGQAVGNATSAAGNNRLGQEGADLAANAQNITAANDYQNQLIARSKLESDQRTQALKDAYRASYATNRTPGPFNTGGLTKYSPEYLASLSALQRQALARLEQHPQYGTDTMAPIPPYTPYVPSRSPNGQPSTLERVGNIVTPALSIVGAIGKYWK